MIFAAPTSLHAKSSGGRREDRNFENSTQMIHVHPLFKPEQKKGSWIIHRSIYSSCM